MLWCSVVTSGRLRGDRYVARPQLGRGTRSEKIVDGLPRRYSSRSSIQSKWTSCSPSSCYPASGTITEFVSSNEAMSFTLGYLVENAKYTQIRFPLTRLSQSMWREHVISSTTFITRVSSTVESETKREAALLHLKLQVSASWNWNRS